MSVQTITESHTTITGLDLNMNRKQPCEIQECLCCTKSHSRFVVSSQQYAMEYKYACPICTSCNTDYSMSKLGRGEEYVYRVTPYFKAIKDKMYSNSAPNRNVLNTSGEYRQDIGDISILITRFHHAYYELTIDKGLHTEYFHRNFSNFRSLYTSTVLEVNKIYQDRILKSIYSDTPFFMP